VEGRDTAHVHGAFDLGHREILCFVNGASLAEARGDELRAQDRLEGRYTCAVFATSTNIHRMKSAHTALGHARALGRDLAGPAGGGASALLSFTHGGSKAGFDAREVVHVNVQRITRQLSNPRLILGQLIERPTAA
jgi:hypothetical protein